MITIRNKIHNLLTEKKNVYQIKDIINYFKEDSIFALLFIFTFPTSIPTPSYGLGSSTLLGGTVALILSIQLFLGYRKAILPNFILNKKFKTRSLKKKYHKRINFILLRMEKFFKRGHFYAFNAVFMKLASILMFLNAILMSIPLIMTNWLPSTTVSFISFAFLFKDGFMFLMALIFAACVFSLYVFIFYYIFNYIKKSNLSFSGFFRKIKNMVKI